MCGLLQLNISKLVSRQKGQDTQEHFLVSCHATSSLDSASKKGSPYLIASTWTKTVKLISWSFKCFTTETNSQYAACKKSFKGSWEFGDLSCVISEVWNFLLILRYKPDFYFVTKRRKNRDRFMVKWKTLSWVGIIYKRIMVK